MEKLTTASKFFYRILCHCRHALRGSDADAETPLNKPIADTNVQSTIAKARAGDHRFEAIILGQNFDAPLTRQMMWAHLKTDFNIINAPQARSSTPGLKATCWQQRGVVNRIVQLIAGLVVGCCCI